MQYVPQSYFATPADRMLELYEYQLWLKERLTKHECAICNGPITFDTFYVTLDSAKAVSVELAFRFLTSHVEPQRHDLVLCKRCFNEIRKVVVDKIAVLRRENEKTKHLNDYLKTTRKSLESAQKYLEMKLDEIKEEKEQDDDHDD